MRHIYTLIFTLISPFLFCQEMDRKYNGDVYQDNHTLNYYQTIDAYSQLDEKYPNARLFTMGLSDAGLPIYCFAVSKKSISTLENITTDKRVFLINNGIHPGESCGVDASISWIAEVLESDSKILDSLSIAIIPMYNVGGSLNRRPHTRANQNGPEGQGFRGNAKHLDLNRDFLKADSKNTFVFYKIFQTLKPIAFIDNHSSNGADYAYETTLIVSPPEKIGPQWESLIKNELLPNVYAELGKKGTLATHYVNVHGHGPEEGFSVFEETPIYSSGYTGLWPCWSIVSETHMLKPYPNRVESTINTLDVLSEILYHNGHELEKAWERDNQTTFVKGELPLVFEIDSNQTSPLSFQGYTEVKSPSKVYRGERRSFDSEKPYSKEIPYYHKLKPIRLAQIPKVIYISQAQSEVLDRLYAQGITGDTVELPKKELMVAHVKSVTFSNRAYEGHIKSELTYDYTVWNQGYYLPVVKIDVNSTNYRYLLNVLHPEAPGSFYRWNFFDSYYQQKEWFSDYIYEDRVEEMVEKDPNYKPVETSNSFGVLYEFYKKDEELFEKDAFTPPVFLEF